MAGVKITDLGTLTAPENADLLYIVDVSDTSESPQGTSKQIEVGNIISSGTFTPTYNFISGITDSSLPLSGVWSRIGETINFGVFLTNTFSLGSGAGSLTMTLPEIINDFIGFDNSSFLINTTDNILGTEKAIIYPNNGTQTATIELSGFTEASTFNISIICIFKR